MAMGEYNPQYKDALDKFLLVIPGVKAGKAFGYPCYKVGTKTFAFVGSKGVSIKVGEARAQELIADGKGYQPFEVAEGMIWKAWVNLALMNAADYEAHLDVFEESIAFTANG